MAAGHKCLVYDCNEFTTEKTDSFHCVRHYRLKQKYGTPTPLFRCTDCFEQYVFVSKKGHSLSCCPNCCILYDSRRKFLRNTLLKYSLTIHDYIELERFRPGCWICKSKDMLHIDHCHNSNNVRGLLCGPCNLMIGHYQSCKGDLVISQFDEYLSLGTFNFTPRKNNNDKIQIA